MQLFEMDNYLLKISPQAYAIKCFRKLYSRDNGKGKRRGMAELSFIYFMEDYRSDFSFYDYETRIKMVTENLELPKGWKPDKFVKEAQEFYREHTKTLRVKLLEDVRGSVEKLRGYYRSVDFTERDKSGKLVFDITKYTTNMKGLGDIMESLDKLESRIRKESQDAADQAKGSMVAAPFEDQEFK